jgi:hypothetical protein
MSEGATSAVGQRAWPVAGWVPAVLLLLGTAAIGPSLGAIVRPAFVIGCGAAGWYAWRSSPRAHLQAALILFAFTPLVRRMVDLSAGFDQTGIMLVGPLLAILAPVPRLQHFLDGERSPGPQTAPMLIVAGCVAYATVLTLMQGEWMNAASGSLKWLAPLLYAAALSETADRDDLVQGATSAFMVILPIIGIIGIYQYVDPPAWDRYWMQFAPIMSAGQPFPYEVRTFSTMNGPASFATFTAAGLLLVCFLRSGWYTSLLVAPAALSLCLSLYRTAWLALAAGVIFCILFASTRVRAAAILFGILGLAVVAATVGPFADVIGERLASLGQGSEDSSAQERLEQLVTLWSQWDSSLLGNGFATVDVGSAGAMAIDGMIAACWFLMGIVVGLLCLVGLVWAVGNAISTAWHDRRREAIVVGALSCGALMQLPLANITSGELGFLFWTFAVLACLRSGPAAARPRGGLAHPRMAPARPRK